MYFFYSLLTAAAMVVLLPYFLITGLRTGKYIHNIRERLGYLPAGFQRNRGGHGAIWVHAVSVGEALASLPLARQLKERFPGRPLYVSTTTLTGQELVRERMDFANGIFYFPIDWRGPVRRVLDAVRPALVVVLETEIWPNFLRECRRAGVPVVFVSGRISPRSFRRYRLVTGLLGPVLRDATLFLMQSPEDALRLGALGAPPDRVVLGGNLKYDLAVPAASPFVVWLESQVTQQGRRPVVVAGSTVSEMEEEQVSAAFSQLATSWPRALLVLAPRKPERFEAVARWLAGGASNAVRRSALDMNQPLDAKAMALLLDSVGELAGLYRLADVCFVGGSLDSRGGGHNILEPASFGKVPVFGPAMTNFAEMAETFLSAGAAIRVNDWSGLQTAWAKLLADSGQREQMGGAARKIVEANRGATVRALERIAAILDAPEKRA